jgi:hypothetical protein
MPFYISLHSLEYLPHLKDIKNHLILPYLDTLVVFWLIEILLNPSLHSSSVLEIKGGLSQFCSYIEIMTTVGKKTLNHEPKTILGGKGGGTGVWIQVWRVEYINTTGSNKLQAEFGTAPASEVGKMQYSCFS